MSHEAYDADGDIDRFLQSPGRESYMLDVPQSGGQIHDVQAADPPALQMPDQAPPATTVEFGAPTIDAAQYQAPAAAFEFQAMPVGVDEHHHTLAFGFQEPADALARHLPAPNFDFEQQMVGAFGFQGQILGVGEGYAASAFGFRHQPPFGFFPALEMDDIQQLHQAPVLGFQAPRLHFGFQQSSATNVNHYQAPIIGFQQQPAMDIEHNNQASGFGFHSSTSDVEHQQASSFVFEFQAPPINVEHHQHPNMEHVVQHHQTPAMEDIVEHQHDLAMDNDVEHHQALAMEDGQEDRVVSSPPASPPQQEEAPVEDEVDMPAIVVQDGFAYVPLVQGQLDCTQCHSVRQVLHGTEHRKLQFLVHRDEQGAFLHAIIHCTSIHADDGEFQTDQLVYVDFRNHSHESAQEFIESRVDDLRKISRGGMEDTCSNISAAPFANNSNSHVEPEINMLGNILMPTPVANGEGQAPESSSQVPVINVAQNSNNVPQASSQNSSVPVNQAEENNDAQSRIKPVPWIGLTPEILESSQVMPYDPNSGTNVLLYPSMTEKIRQREQARMVNLTVEDACKMFDEVQEEITREPSLSSSIFKQLCREDKEYRRHARRINALNGKILKLITKAPQKMKSMSGLLSIMQKMEMHRQEKADLFASIEIGLQEMENNDGAAGPSGT